MFVVPHGRVDRRVEVNGVSLVEYRAESHQLVPDGLADFHFGDASVAAPLSRLNRHTHVALKNGRKMHVDRGDGRTASHGIEKFQVDENI